METDQGRTENLGQLNPNYALGNISGVWT